MKVNYKRVFRDVCNGFSECWLGDKKVYIKHFSIFDQVDLEDVYEYYYDKAKARGLPTEEENLKLLIEEGEWSEEADADIKKEEELLESLIAQKSALVLKSKIDKKREEINNQRDVVNKKIMTKKGLLGSTCEKFADDRVNDLYITKSFYLDTELSQKLYSDEEFNELGNKDLVILIQSYNKIMDASSEENVKRLALEDFFFPYLSLTESPKDFFGRACCEMTNSQIQLILYTKVFKNIFDHHENIPEAIRKDPDALIDYANSNEKIKDVVAKEKEDGAAMTMMGATKEDIEQIKKESGGRVVSLRDEAKKKGGVLSMEDMMKLSGA